jgi:uncharacterized protein with beta-barrel porin domain
MGLAPEPAKPYRSDRLRLASAAFEYEFLKKIKNGQGVPDFSSSHNGTDRVSLYTIQDLLGAGPPELVGGFIVNKFVRSLLSGASLATLQLCAVGAARASSINITGAQTTGPVTIAPGQSPDYILVNGTITGDLTNEGTVGPVNYYGAEINGTITGSLVNAATGIISGTEVGVIVGTGASIHGGISNAGKILVANTTHTTGSTRGTAINYHAAAVAVITNSGTLGVKVQVNGTGTDYARANAYGVFEDVNAGGGANGTVSYSGSGAINLSAIAVATSSQARALAYAESAIYQSVSHAGVAKETINNTGSLSLSAAAKAIATSRSATQAKAYAGSALRQYAQNANTAHGSSVGLTITNSGALSVVAKATAVGETKAKAFGRVEDVFSQYAYNADAIAQTVTNSGALTLSAAAKATAAVSHSTVQATAAVEDIFHQNAYNNSTNGASIAQSITNSGDISITLSAQALRSIAGTGSRNVSADVRAQDLFSQRAYNVTDVTQAIVNSGSITINGKATSTGVRSRTYAQARVEDVFYQDANADNSATLSIINSAPITVAMTALANGPRARAYASVQSLAYQNAGAGQTASEQFTNSGIISLGMAASAVGNHVSAEAQLDGGIKQYGYGGTSLAQSIVNSGSLIFNLSANAKGTSRATAVATGKKLFEQYSQGSASIAQSLVNSGTVSVGLAATAAAASGSAHARATMTNNSAIKQYAQNTLKVVQAITNSGSLTFNFSANAKGVTSDITAKAAAEGPMQTARGDGTISQTLTNSGTLGFDLAAVAVNAGTTDAARATAKVVDAINQYAEYTGTAAGAGEITQVVTNSGTISVTLSANAKGGEAAQAEVGARALIQQNARDAGTTTEMVTNSGTISVVNTATASGLADVFANAYSDGFVEQGTRSVADASISAVNTGSILAHSFANAVGTGFVEGKAYARGVDQYIDRDHLEGDLQGVMTFSNSGTIDLLAAANVTGGLGSEARASASGVKQYINDEGATAGFNNSGSFTVAAVATGLRGAPGAAATTTRLPSVRANAVGLSVKAFGESGVFVNGTVVTTHTDKAPVTLAISNSGTFKISASANGTALGAANISAYATGLAANAHSQIASSRYNTSNGHTRTYGSIRHEGAGLLNGVVNNSGSLLVTASAQGGFAEADGVVLTAGTVDADVVNAKGGLISAAAVGATAAAVGISQGATSTARRDFHTTRWGTTAHNGLRITGETSTYLRGAATSVTGDITNSGTIRVDAVAVGGNLGNDTQNFADTPYGPNVKAWAEGILVNAETMSGNILNAGYINVTARGQNAVANGIHVLASQAGTHYTNVNTYKYRGTASGSQWTHTRATMPVHTAVLPGSTFSGKLSNSGTISVVAAGTNAKATGVLIEDAVYNGAFVNTGNIAVIGSGTGASAEGVVIDAASLGSGASFQNNGGTVSATLNGNRGTAIDVSGAPSALALGLNGGSIYGNVVENAAGNAITVGSGNLVLDGIINPSKAKLGSLTVGANGTLTLANNAAEGNATAYVNTYVQPGTLVINGAADGTSGSVHAAHATLSGAAIVNLNLAGAAYGTDTTYKVVFSDAPLTGTWSGVTPNGATTFFSASGAYSTNEADITLTRATFNSIGGLTNNEKSVGSLIETIYESSGLNGPLGKLLGALFNLSPQQYADALETLSGVPAGELASANQSTAQSFMDQINGHLGDPSTGGDTVASLMSGSSVLAANAAPTDVTPAQASTFSGTRVWGGGFQSGSSVDRTASGPAYSSHQSGLLAAVDMPVSRDLLLGIAGSYSTGSLKTENLLGYGTFNAAQIAGYARYADDSGLYAVGSVSYGDFTNKLSRFISIPGFGSGNVHGKFDSSAWGLYGEAGWSFDPSTWALSLTPYAAVSYLDAKSNGYTETGFGAPLTIGGTSSSATSSYLGVKLSTDWQLPTATLTPRLTAAWQHDYTKNAWEMSAAFAAVPTVGFGLNGSGLSRDGAFVDGGITLHIAEQVDVLLDYQGRFTSDRTDNAFMARANVRF